MPEPESYVVRVYRRDPASPDRINGVVEVLPHGLRWPFASTDELVRILVPDSGFSNPQDRDASEG